MKLEHAFFLLLGLFCSINVNNANAAPRNGNSIPIFLNSGTVEVQLQAEQWVSTTSALVTISADATLNSKDSKNDKNGGFTQTRKQLLQKFNEIASDTTWNITAFNTSQSGSGLDQVHLEAQARLPENRLANLRTKAKDLSEPGLTLRLVSIDFSPSIPEVEAAKANLRSTIYNEAKIEVTRINKIYPEQNYVLRSIYFQQTSATPIPMLMNTMTGGFSRSAGTSNAQIASIDSTTISAQKLSNSENDGGDLIMAVSTKIQLNATVELTPAKETSFIPHQCPCTTATQSSTPIATKK